MILSIRRFLLVNLLLSITITTTLTAIGTYFIDQRDIQKHLDLLLSQATMSFQILFEKDFQSRDLEKLQEQLNAIPKRSATIYKRHYGEQTTLDYLAEEYSDKFQFQIWDKTGRLLLHSANAPKEPLSEGKIGFSDKYIKDTLWRIFTTYETSNGLTIIVAERYDIRGELGRKITRDEILIMTLTFPLLGLLIWMIVGKGLDSLKSVAYEVAHRVPTYLEPVDNKAVPAEIKPLIDELNNLLVRLQQALEREKRFAANAAHELRTPLAALKTQTQIALKAKNKTDLTDALHNVLAGVDRSSHVIQQLLTLSRLIPEEANLEDAVVAKLPKIAAEIIADLIPTALAKQIEIELIAENENLKILCYPTAIGILIRNLVDNAIRYSDENGTIKVFIDRTAKNIVLRVVDDGPGIPEELRARVFERFFRILGTKATGSGLGLAIVQLIVKLHKAEIVLATPENGRGLEVRVLFARA